MTTIAPELAALAEAAALRAKHMTGQAQQGEPAKGERARLASFRSEMRAKLIEKDGREFHKVEGYASTVDEPYEMFDMFGPYTETVDGAAFDRTLAAKPDVAFLLNHKGMTMARTTNGTLELSADALGLRANAYLNPTRADVRDLVSAIDDRLIDEMSFAFMITDAAWNDDYSQFTIREVDLDRGDVSAVNYGANPFTSINARAREVLRDVAHLPVGPARAALAALQARTDLRTERVADMGGLDVGDRVQVIGTPHAEGQTTGTVAEVSGVALGIIFDSMPDVGIHHWYTGEELALIAPASGSEMAAVMATTRAAGAMAETATEQVEAGGRRLSVVDAWLAERATL